jgi:hypothetical protein
MLALADKDGIVPASVPGLANLSRISIEKCEEALGVLAAPDKYSRTVEFEGRRIEKVDGGWRLLNHGKYRRMLSAEERREYLATKQREYRSRKHASTNVTNVSDTDTRLTHTDSDTKADTKERKKNPSPTKTVGGELGSSEFLQFWAAYPKRVDRQEALHAWVKGLLDGSLGAVLAGLECWKRTEQWQDMDKIPYPSTWLNKRRWKDSPQTGAKVSPAEQKARKTDEAIERVRERLGTQVAPEVKQALQR